MKSYVNMSDYAVNERNKRALDDLVWRVMENEKGSPFTLAEFLTDHPSDELAFLLAQSLWDNSSRLVVRNTVESHIRSHLEGSEAVERRAEEMATEDS